MDLTQYVSALRDDLASAAAAGDEQTPEPAPRWPEPSSPPPASP